MLPPHIFLLSDFGADNLYTGIMQAIIAGICPHAMQHSLTQSIQPYNILQGAYRLASSVRSITGDSIIIAVIDPGVGGNRRAVACRFQDYTILCPDNGLLTLVLEQSLPLECVELTNTRYHLPKVSHTFHGRDVFAPVAAYLAQGIDIREFGNPIPHDSLARLAYPKAQQQPDGSWLCGILDVDNFGNIISSLSVEKLDTSPEALLHWQLQIGDIFIPRLSRTYTDVAPASFLGYIGSSGFVEIGLREGNAYRELGSPALLDIRLFRT